MAQRIPFYKKGSLYIKQNEQPMALVPLPFWSTIVQLSTKDRLSSCFIANLERMYDHYQNKKVFRKHIATLLAEDHMLQVGRRSYMLNPIYVHRGSHQNTERAIQNYEAEKEAQAQTGGKTPWVHPAVYETVNDAMAHLAKSINSGFTFKDDKEDEKDAKG